MMDWTVRLTPDSRIKWAHAMATEFEAIAADQESIYFALGCLKTALVELLRTRSALNMLGRMVMATGLAMMCLVGLLVAANAQHTPFQTTIFYLSLAYGLAAILAAFSLKMLRIYAFFGAILSFSILAGTHFDFYLQKGLPANLVMALSMEATGLMTAVLLASTFLMLLHSPELDLPADG